MRLSYRETCVPRVMVRLLVTETCRVNFYPAQTIFEDKPCISKRRVYVDTEGRGHGDYTGVVITSPSTTCKRDSHTT
jgi:hypothetical protein